MEARELKEWAKIPFTLFVGLAIHFAGWWCAAPADKWHLWVGIFGFSGSVLGMLIIGGLGSVKVAKAAKSKK